MEGPLPGASTTLMLSKTFKSALWCLPASLFDFHWGLYSSLWLLEPIGMVLILRVSRSCGYPCLYDFVMRSN